MKSTVALIAIIVGLTPLTGCGDKEPAASGTDAKPTANGPSKPNTAVPPSTASSADRRPQENESDLLPTMK